MTEYPEDEFDVAAKQRGPKGVHRQAEATLRRLAPYLIVLVVAPLLAWGIISLLNEDRVDPPVVTLTAETSTTASSPDATTTAAEATASAEPTETATTSPEPTAAPVNFDAPVVVLNGARVAGIAARTADALTAAGFTAVTTGDYAAAQPTVTTVFYKDADLLPTAQAIGAELGIDTLVELGSATNSISVVLRTDFEG